MFRTRTVVAAGCALSLVLVPATSADAKKAPKFANCKAMNAKYPHGVGRKGAHDKTSGTPVTTFKISNKIYKANKSRDRDKDGVACEKR